MLMRMLPLTPQIVRIRWATTWLLPNGRIVETITVGQVLFLQLMRDVMVSVAYNRTLSPHRYNLINCRHIARDTPTVCGYSWGYLFLLYTCAFQGYNRQFIHVEDYDMLATLRTRIMESDDENYYMPCPIMPTEHIETFLS